MSWQFPHHRYLNKGAADIEAYNDNIRAVRALRGSLTSHNFNTDMRDSTDEGVPLTATGFLVSAAARDAYTMVDRVQGAALLAYTPGGLVTSTKEVVQGNGWTPIYQKSFRSPQRAELTAVGNLQYAYGGAVDEEVHYLADGAQTQFSTTFALGTTTRVFLFDPATGDTVAATGWSIFSSGPPGVIRFTTAPAEGLVVIIATFTVSVTPGGLQFAWRLDGALLGESFMGGADTADEGAAMEPGVSGWIGAEDVFGDWVLEPGGHVLELLARLEASANERTSTDAVPKGYVFTRAVHLWERYR